MKWQWCLILWSLFDWHLEFDGQRVFCQIHQRTRRHKSRGASSWNSATAWYTNIAAVRISNSAAYVCNALGSGRQTQGTYIYMWSFLNSIDTGRFVRVSFKSEQTVFEEGLTLLSPPTTMDFVHKVAEHARAELIGQIALETHSWSFITDYLNPTRSFES